MLPKVAATELNQLGHDAIWVRDVGLGTTPDSQVFEYAVVHDRAMVTENFGDYSILLEQRLSSRQEIVPVVFVHKKDFPQGGALAKHLASHLHAWAKQNPDPYRGAHWP